MIEKNGNFFNVTNLLCMLATQVFQTQIHDNKIINIKIRTNLL